MISSGILQTLIYSDHFGYPLTFAELYARLVGVKTSKKQLIHSINQMIESGLIEQSGEYYYLPSHKSCVSRRLNRAKISAFPIIRARTLSKRLAKIPGVLAIYLTGSLAMKNGVSNDDIDLLVITHNNRLWITRLLITLYTEFFGLRRHPGSKDRSGKLCLNLYLTPTAFSLPPFKHSLYTAYELIQAIPLYDPQNTHVSLLSANQWISTYLPNFIVPNSKSPEFDHADNWWSVYFGSKIERIAYQLQFAYMKNKITREYITLDSAFFHPHDPGSKVLKLVEKYN